LAIVCVVSVLAIGYAFVPALEIAGYVRHLAVIGPLVALFACAGAQRMPQLENRNDFFRVRDATMVGGAIALTVASFVVAPTRGLLLDAALGVGVAILCLVLPRGVAGTGRAALSLSLVSLVGPVATVRPFAADAESTAIRSAAAWYVGHTPPGGRLLSAHPEFDAATGLDPFDSPRHESLDQGSLASAGPGTMIVWDSHISPIAAYRVTRTMLSDTNRFNREARFSGGRFTIEIYRVLGDR